MHYYQFNIGDYKSHTSGLSIIEDIAYRRILDIYYLNERPLNGCSTFVAREIGMRDHVDEVEYVLGKFFVCNGDGKWKNKRAETEIKNYHRKKKVASAAGRASGKARRSKGSERTFDFVQPNINHKPLTNNQEPGTGNQGDSGIPPQNPGTTSLVSTPKRRQTKTTSSQSSDEDVEMANSIWTKVQALAPDQKKPNMNTWANDLRKMREIDKRTPDQIMELFTWANQDNFWQSNIRSPAKLRKQFDQLNIKRKSNGSGGDKSKEAWDAAINAVCGNESGTIIEGELE